MNLGQFTGNSYSSGRLMFASWFSTYCAKSRKTGHGSLVKISQQGVMDSIDVWEHFSLQLSNESLAQA